MRAEQQKAVHGYVKKPMQYIAKSVPGAIQGRLRVSVRLAGLVICCCLIIGGAWANGSSYISFEFKPELVIPPYPATVESVNDIERYQLELEDFRLQLQARKGSLERYRVGLEDFRQSLEDDKNAMERPTILAWDDKEALRKEAVELEKRRIELEASRAAADSDLASGSLTQKEYDVIMDATAYDRFIREYRVSFRELRAAQREYDKEHSAFQQYLRSIYYPGVEQYHSLYNTSFKANRDENNRLTELFKKRADWARKRIEQMRRGI